MSAEYNSWLYQIWQLKSVDFDNWLHQLNQLNLYHPGCQWVNILPPWAPTGYDFSTLGTNRLTFPQAAAAAAPASSASTTAAQTRWTSWSSSSTTPGHYLSGWLIHYYRAGHFWYFLNFFNNTKWFFAFIVKVIWLGVGFLNRTAAETGY